MSKVIGVNKMRFVVLTLVVLVAVVSTALGDDAVSSREQCTGIWAAAAKSPYPAPDFIPTKIPAPNGRVSINATREGLSLVGKKNRTTHLEVLVNPPLMEVLWAPDSQNFVINVSDGGLVGTWEAKYYSIDADGRPVSRDIQKLVKSNANRLLRCEPKEEANIGVASWLNDGKEVLIIAEVPPHSSCRNMGTIFGFRVSVKSGKIIERISEDGLRKKWAHILGCRFAGKIERIKREM